MNSHFPEAQVGRHTLSENRLPIQENYGGLYTRLTELSYERTLFVKPGYMAMGNTNDHQYPIPLADSSKSRPSLSGKYQPCIIRNSRLAPSRS
ncbi:MULTISPECIES: hypothetical protein [unclassified Pseudomonas]|uniref:hypothetical protein n=1 Tax=unclassified Pseudomonas TaxID=196821 RepID=UPI001CBF9F42|nr:MULTISPECIES: hypothetical protein [unclassified Pseudomonas]